MIESHKNISYDRWILWSVNSQCNFRCAYCWSKTDVNPYETSEANHLYAKIKLVGNKWMDKWNKARTIGFFSAVRLGCHKLFPSSPDVNISALVNTLDKTGEVFRIGLTGGEPFLVGNFVEACVEITKKHYIHVITNLSSPKIKEFCERVDPNKVLAIYASCHIKELERLGLIDKYISNYLMCKQRGFMIHAYERGYPPLLHEVDKYKRYFQKKGVELKFATFFGKYNGRSYPDDYTPEDIKIFGLEDREDRAGYNSKNKLCIAGYTAGIAYSSGDVFACYGLNAKMGNIYDLIRFEKKPVRCPKEHCLCPLFCHDPYLNKKALAEFM